MKEDEAPSLFIIIFFFLIFQALVEQERTKSEELLDELEEVLGELALMEQQELRSREVVEKHQQTLQQLQEEKTELERQLDDTRSQLERQVSKVMHTQQVVFTPIHVFVTTFNSR